MDDRTQLHLLAKDPTKGSKRSLIILAIAWTILGLGTATLPWLPVAWFWSLFYFVAAAASFKCAMKFDDVVVAAVAGASAIVANVMRGSVIIYSRLIEEPLTLSWTGGQMVVGVTLPWVLAFAMWILFFQRVALLGTLERARK